MKLHFEIAKWTDGPGGRELEDVWAACGRTNVNKTIWWKDVTCKQCLKHKPRRETE